MMAPMKRTAIAHGRVADAAAMTSERSLEAPARHGPISARRPARRFFFRPARAPSHPSAFLPCLTFCIRSLFTTTLAAKHLHSSELPLSHPQLRAESPLWLKVALPGPLCKDARFYPRHEPPHRLRRLRQCHCYYFREGRQVLHQRWRPILRQGYVDDTLSYIPCSHPSHLTC